MDPGHRVPFPEWKLPPHISFYLITLEINTLYFQTSKRSKNISDVPHWNRLLREASRDAPSPEVLKARLSGALGNPIWWEVSLPIPGVWN